MILTFSLEKNLMRPALLLMKNRSLAMAAGFREFHESGNFKIWLIHRIKNQKYGAEDSICSCSIHSDLNVEIVEVVLNLVREGARVLCQAGHRRCTKAKCKVLFY